jgi:hypothetical protein
MLATLKVRLCLVFEIWSGWMYPYANASLSKHCRLLHEKYFAQTDLVGVVGGYLASTMVVCIVQGRDVVKPCGSAWSNHQCEVSLCKNRNTTSGRYMRDEVGANQDETREVASLIHHYCARRQKSALDTRRRMPAGSWCVTIVLLLQHCLLKHSADDDRHVQLLR